MPTFKENPDAMASGYKMKYQGAHSAFPFKSPMRDEKKIKFGVNPEWRKRSEDPDVKKSRSRFGGGPRKSREHIIPHGTGGDPWSYKKTSTGKFFTKKKGTTKWIPIGKGSKHYGVISKLKFD